MKVSQLLVSALSLGALAAPTSIVAKALEVKSLNGGPAVREVIPNEPDLSYTEERQPVAVATELAADTVEDILVEERAVILGVGGSRGGEGEGGEPTSGYHGSGHTGSATTIQPFSSISMVFFISTAILFSVQ